MRRSRAITRERIYTLLIFQLFAINTHTYIYITHIHAEMHWQIYLMYCHETYLYYIYIGKYNYRISHIHRILCAQSYLFTIFFQLFFFVISTLIYYTRFSIKIIKYALIYNNKLGEYNNLDE